MSAGGRRARSIAGRPAPPNVDWSSAANSRGDAWGVARAGAAKEARGYPHLRRNPQPRPPPCHRQLQVRSFRIVYCAGRAAFALKEPSRLARDLFGSLTTWWEAGLPFRADDIPVPYENRFFPRTTASCFPK